MGGRYGNFADILKEVVMENHQENDAERERKANLPQR